MTGIPAGILMTAGHVQLLLTVLAITILSFLGVDILYKIVSLQVAYRQAFRISQPAAAALPGQQTQPMERYQIITQRNLFATTLQAIVDKNAGESLLPTEEYTAYDLKGTIAVSQSMGYAIVEEKGKGSQKLYRLGEMIGSARLIRITRHTAVLKGGEKEFIMKIKDVAEGPLMAPSGGPGSDIAVSRQEVTASLGDLKSIMSQAVVRPFFNEGKQQGFVVSNIVPGSLYQKLGLQNGDVIVDVNNKKLEGADDLVQLMNTMQAGGSVTVNLMRNGKNEIINYSFH
jgi:general secretion pathway protein C